MIFVTVGHQMPFDRLVTAVDGWAGEHPDREIFGQIGAGATPPRNFDSVARLDPADFRQRLEQATAVIAHAGMGTIISALRPGKPLLVLPRRAHLGETRTDHQVPTARHFADGGWLLAAADERDLADRIDELAAFRPRSSFAETAPRELIDRLRRFAA